MTDAAVPQATYDDVWTRTTDGLRLHARQYGHPTARLPVVCLPGLTRNSSEFHPLALELLAAGAVDRIVAVDYRGRGLSDHDPDSTNYAIPVETADLLALLSELSISAAIFVGVSRGGLISMGLAASHPGLIRGLILNDIGPVLEREGLLRIKGYVGRFGVPAGMEAAALSMKARFGDQFPNLTDAEWHAWAETVWTPSESGLKVAYDPALARALGDVDETTPIPALWSLFDALADVPVMIIRGGLSDLLSATTVLEMSRRHPGLLAIEVPDEGHTPFMHRPAIAEHIVQFIRSVEASQP